MKRLGFIALLLMCCMGCGKTGDVVPNVGVSLQVVLADPRFNAIKNIGGAVEVNGYGVAGIIIYRSPYGYVAYDRCSSYQPANRCAITLDNPSLTATDPCSGSKFSMTDGTPVKAPATRSLKQYSVTSTQFELYVSN
jgi:hypothetical protein